MATGTTPLRGRPYPLETDAPDVAADMHTLALNLDQVPNITSGTTLPVSGMVAGDEFLLTTTGAWYKYSGVAWVPIVVTTRGAVSIAASQSTTSTTYTTLTTPDQVTGIVLPPNGLLRIRYQAMWQMSSVSANAQAAIFLGSNQLQIAAGTAPVVQSAGLSGSGSAAFWTPLASTPVGLASMHNAGANYSGDVTTGQIIGIANSQPVTTFYAGVASGTAFGSPGGPCELFAAAGTYTVSVQFKVDSGSVTVENRKLWVEAVSLS